MIKLLKSGKWALEGREVIELAEGEEKSFGPGNDFALVEAGWAEWIKSEAASAQDNPVSEGKLPRSKAAK